MKRAEYNHATRELIIWFPEGKPYNFCNVPEHVFTGLCNALSKGEYYNDHIRDRYPC
ncbi:MAG: KTSC domain-containing protein [Polymorphobacter sp.]|uniref:KTSC domain-containing protein n=1 Tax=Polymorphobacter sp. TaxID=1909290 RepID=UPI003A85AB17